MTRTLAVAAVLAALTATAHARTTTVTQTTETSQIIGVVEGDGVKMATKEQTTVTTADNDIATDTQVDTADYSRYFDDAGNPIYLPDVTFSLE